MNQDRDCVTIGNRRVIHSTAQRDWVCGRCGSTLVTRWYEDQPHWRTLCAQDAAHPVDRFVHKSAWAYLEHKCRTEALLAGEVLAHLPATLRATIQEDRERRETCPSRE